MRALLPAIPAEVTVLTWTSGNLSNGGETVELSDNYRNVIDTVDIRRRRRVADFDGRGRAVAGTDQSGAPEHRCRGLEGVGRNIRHAGPASTASGRQTRRRSSPRSLHQPVIPQPNQSVTITARVLDDAGAPQSVTLHYRLDAQVSFVNPNPYIDVPMYDDGTHGDVSAGNALYTAVVPGQANDQQMDFYISAGDGVNTGVAPAYHSTLDAKGNPSQTFLCKFSNEVLPTDFPVYHMLITQANRAWQESLTGEIDGKMKFDATFIDGSGNLWYNVVERYRGQSSMYIWPRSFRIDFPSNRPLTSVLGFPTYKLQLLGHFPVRQKMGYELFNKAGIPAPMTGWARFRSTGHNYDTFGYGSDGFYGLYCAAERIEGDFLDSQDGGVTPPRNTTGDGNLYRGEHDGDLRWEGWDPNAYRTDVNGRNGYSKENNEEEDYWDDLIDVIDWLNNHGEGDEYAAGVEARIEENEWAGFFGVHTVMGNREGAIYRDTGDDYYIYFNPPTDPNGWNSQLIPWDLDAVMTDGNETIWRQNVNAVRKWIRHNAFAPYYLRWLRRLMDDEFSQAQMDALIDSMPNAAFAPSGGSDTYPLTKAQFKNWTRNRRTFMESEIRDGLTVTGIPASPYTDTNPVIQVSGLLDQNHTATVRVNGELATFSIYGGTWSKSVTLIPGLNDVVVEAYDLDGSVRDTVSNEVFYNPPGSQQLSLWMRAPRRMINDKPLTIEAKIVDEAGRPDYTKWNVLGSVSVVRLPDRTPVAITDTVFDSHLRGPGRLDPLLQRLGQRLLHARSGRGVHTRRHRGDGQLLRHERLAGRDRDRQPRVPDDVRDDRRRRPDLGSEREHPRHREHDGSVRKHADDQPRHARHGRHDRRLGERHADHGPGPGPGAGNGGQPDPLLLRARPSRHDPDAVRVGLERQLLARLPVLRVGLVDVPARLPVGRRATGRWCRIRGRRSWAVRHALDHRRALRVRRQQRDGVLGPGNRALHDPEEPGLARRDRRRVLRERPHAADRGHLVDEQRPGAGGGEPGRRPHPHRRVGVQPADPELYVR